MAAVGEQVLAILEDGSSGNIDERTCVFDRHDQLFPVTEEIKELIKGLKAQVDELKQLKEKWYESSLVLEYLQVCSGCLEAFLRSERILQHQVDELQEVRRILSTIMEKTEEQKLLKEQVPKLALLPAWKKLQTPYPSLDYGMWQLTEKERLDTEIGELEQSKEQLWERICVRVSSAYHHAASSDDDSDNDPLAAALPGEQVLDAGVTHRTTVREYGSSARSWEDQTPVFNAMSSPTSVALFDNLLDDPTRLAITPMFTRAISGGDDLLPEANGAVPSWVRAVRSRPE